MEETCDQMLLEDLKTNGVERFGPGPSQNLIDDLYERAKERLAEDRSQYLGLMMVALLFDKRQQCFVMAFCLFKKNLGFAVPYGKAVRRGRIDALCKILCAKEAEIKKMPPLQPWPLTVQKEFVIYSYSFPYECELCNILRFARLHQLGLHDH